MTAITLEQSYGMCDQIARSEGKNFYWAFWGLPKSYRMGMTAVYAFARLADDAADQEGIAPNERLERIRKIREDFREALNGHTPAAGHRVMAALADTVARFSLSPKYLEMILDGAEQDLRISRYATFDALKDYCRLVASSVGLISLELLGCRDQKALPLAENLGVALQLTNILRDVREDAGRGRIYLPQEDLQSAGCSEADILNGNRTDAFLKVCAINAARAREHYESAYPLLSHLSTMARRAVAMMAALYARILRKIEAGNFPVLKRRVALSRLEKTLIFLSVLLHPTYDAGKRKTCKNEKRKNGKTGT